METAYFLFIFIFHIFNLEIEQFIDVTAGGVTSKIVSSVQAMNTTLKGQIIQYISQLWPTFFCTLLQACVYLIHYCSVLNIFFYRWLAAQGLPQSHFRSSWSFCMQRAKNRGLQGLQILSIHCISRSARFVHTVDFFSTFASFEKS